MMALPWLTVGKLVIENLDDIVRMVKPAFTRKKAELPNQTDLLNQQIAELQAASSSNAQQIQELAAQLKQIVTALERAAVDAAADRRRTRVLCFAAIAVAGLSLVVALIAVLLRT
jgi:hypothetical protein